MKKILFGFLLFFIAGNLYSQEKLPTKSVYLELGGPGLPYSFNYDFRFDKEKVDSWGMRLGFGGFAAEGESFFSIPIMANRLMGKGPHYFEIGIGATFFTFSQQEYGYAGCVNCVTSSDYNFILDVDGSPSVMGTLNFGYRKVPVDGGFMWKININPIFNNNGFWPLFAGVGFGYSF
ncbi:hypothetical protein [Algoriphagus sp.]|uniref:hypothetical protein n=1 Tax=Algoriphagus sp. TaxID=1872435 RepID=UPI0025DE953B|nr:hypothetical protein [Algoriphagus sp.]